MFAKVGNDQHPGTVCGSNHASLPGADTTAFPGLHGLEGTISGAQNGRKRNMRGPITLPPSTTGLFLRRRRRLRFIFSVACPFSEKAELVGDDGEGVWVLESLRASSDSASPCWGCESSGIVSAHRSRSKPLSSQRNGATFPSRGVSRGGGAKGTPQALGPKDREERKLGSARMNRPGTFWKGFSMSEPIRGHDGSTIGAI